MGHLKGQKSNVKVLLNSFFNGTNKLRLGVLRPFENLRPIF